jgi:hypothetical protein
MLTNEILATINEDRDMNDNIIALQQLGGLDGLIEKMETNPKMGLQCNDKELQKRRECYGSNVVSKSRMEIHPFIDFFCIS